MDYGHTDKSNPLGSPNSLGAPSNDVQRESQSDFDRQRDQRDLGNRIIGSAEMSNLSEKTESIDQTNELPNINPELGKIVNLDMPPGVEDNTAKKPGEIIEASFNKTVIKTGNKLDRKSVKEVGKIISMFNNKNIADAYDTARSATDANLYNSFGREIGKSA